jgi:hypothetical protein
MWLIWEVDLRSNSLSHAACAALAQVPLKPQTPPQTLKFHPSSLTPVPSPKSPQPPALTLSPHPCPPHPCLPHPSPLTPHPSPLTPHPRPLEQVLEASHDLRVLNLSHNRVNAGGLQALCDGLVVNTSLSHLFLSNNPLVSTPHPNPTPTPKPRPLVRTSGSHSDKLIRPAGSPKRAFGSDPAIQISVSDETVSDAEMIAVLEAQQHVMNATFERKRASEFEHKRTPGAARGAKHAQVRVSRYILPCDRIMHIRVMKPKE